MFDQKIVLITGGTGTFGRSCTKALINNFKVKKIIVFSRDEQKQAQMAKEFNSPLISYVLGDVRDYDRLYYAMNGSDYVIHSAALKHVDISESNPSEFVRTNIYGTENVIKSAINNNIKKAVLISTDKAVSPINLYGSTKMISEKLFISANNLIEENKTCFSVVRYGNVLMSRGSIIPYFKELLKAGIKELPVTDINMTRFWITAKTATDFVIKSFSLMNGGEIFIPKCSSMKIVDIVKALDPNSKIKITGIRPGEKIHETLCPEELADETFEFPDYYLINASKQVLNNQSSTKVSKGFKYSSNTNKNWLSESQFLEAINNA